MSDEYDITNTPLPPCPICDAVGEKQLWCSTFSGSYGAGSVIISLNTHKFFGKNIRAVPVVCTQCGYVRLFVNPQEFQEVPPPESNENG